MLIGIACPLRNTAATSTRGLWVLPSQTTAKLVLAPGLMYRVESQLRKSYLIQ